jgi:hypothetical protein
MGTIVAISDVGATSVEVNTRAVPGRSKSAVLAADQILKGQAAGQITIQFTQTDFFVGYPGIGAGQYRIFFLKTPGGEVRIYKPILSVRSCHLRLSGH